MLIILIYGWINYNCNLGKLPESKQQREMEKRENVTQPTTSLLIYSSIPGYGKLLKAKEVNETEI